MSEMLIVLLSGLSLLGAIMIDPQEVSNEADDTPVPMPDEPVERGTNPIDIAVQTSETQVVSPDLDTVLDTTLDTGNQNDQEADTITGFEQADTIIACAGDDIFDGRLDDDTISGGGGADIFVRLSSMGSRALVTDFDVAEDLIVIEHQSDTLPTIGSQTVASDGVILDLSDSSQIKLAELTEEINA